MKHLLRALGTSTLVGLLAIGASADTIYMKNGSVIRGTVVGFSGGQFTVLMNAGANGSRSRAMLAQDEIERIEFENGNGNPRGAGKAGRTGDSQPVATTPAPADSGPGYQPGDTQPADTGSSMPPDNGSAPPYDGSAQPDNGSTPPDNGGYDPVGAQPASTSVPVQGTGGSQHTQISVSPRSDWTNSMILVQRGSRVRVTATGTVKLDSAGRRVAGPAGIDVPERDKLMPGRATGALVAVIGDDNDDFIYVGSQAEFVAQRNGYLFFGVNEGSLGDNSGAFDVQVTVDPSGSQPVASNNPRPRDNGAPVVRRNQPPAGAPPSNRQPASSAPASRPSYEPPPQSAPRRDEPYTPPADADNGGSSVPQPAPATGTAVRETDVQVQSTFDWTNTKIRVQRGSRVRISASGSVRLDAAGRKVTGPGGIDVPDNDRLIPNRPTGALIAVVGDDNDDFIFVGQASDFVAQHDGVLFLSLNEGTPRDNSGTFSAHVVIEQPQINAPGGSAPVSTSASAPAQQRPAAQPAAQRQGGSLPPPIVDENRGAPAPKPVPAIGPNGGQAELVVQAKGDWTSTQITVKKGARIRISASGTAKLDATTSTTPAGVERPDPHKLIPNKPTGGLIAVIGDDNADYIFVGTQAEFVAPRDGILFLSINEGELADNSGSFNVRVVVEPPKR